MPDAVPKFRDGFLKLADDFPKSGEGITRLANGVTRPGCRSTSASLATTSTSVPGTGVWRYLRLAGTGGAVVAAIEYTYNLGTVLAGFWAPGTSTSSAVRTDGGSRAYLDRNFYLTATTQTFTGSGVRVRFFGLSSKLVHLQAADANAPAASLKASQYSGANEDCDLSNNPSGISTLLAVPATTLSGADWFTAEALVADHFSEFCLTGASQLLPVQLLNFTATATASGPAAVRLTWATAHKTNSARFEVEHSADGLAWGTVGTVAAGSSLTARAYCLTDARLPTGAALLYHRLRQVDLDGTNAYSPVRPVWAARACACIPIRPVAAPL